MRTPSSCSYVNCLERARKFPGYREVPCLEDSLYVGRAQQHTMLCDMKQISAGESILMCKASERGLALRLCSSQPEPIGSCLRGVSTALKRALLEVGFNLPFFYTHLLHHSIFLNGSEENYHYC